MKHVLILEDTLEVVAALIKELDRIERLSGKSIDISMYSTSSAVEDIVNMQPSDTYDVIILDRNCKEGGSFHVLDIEKFGSEKVVSISSMPHLNEQVRSRGVEHVVDKDHGDLEGFSRAVGVHVQKILDV